MHLLRMTRRATQRGMTLLECLLALMALISLMTLCSTVLQQHRERAAALVTVRQLKAVAQAARNYVEDHAAEFTTPHNTCRRPRDKDNTRDLPLIQLINADYLRRNFQQKNAYQQAYKIRVCRHNTLAQWQVWVTTEQGRAIPLRDWKQIGPLLGESGAYAHERGGEMLSWQASWDSSATAIVKPGHLVLYHSVQAPDLYSNDTLLYRKKIPTHPHYQQMKTPLKLQQHAILFEAPQQQGKVSAQGVQFEQTTTAGTHHASIDLTSESTGPSSQIMLNNPKQHYLEISPTAVQITAPSIMSRKQTNHFAYNTADKILKLITEQSALPPHYGSQLHREWNQIPYHHLPYYDTETEKDRRKKIDDTAYQICLLGQQSHQNRLKTESKKSNLYPRLGRLFIIGNLHCQQSTVFICGKAKFGQHVRPYSIYSTPPLLKNKSAEPAPPIETSETKQITGLKIRELDKSDPQAILQRYLFLYESVEKILFLINFEETFSKMSKNNKADDQKTIKFINNLKNFEIERLEKIKKSPELKKRIEHFKNLLEKFDFYNNGEDISELFFNYCLDRCNNENNHECDKTDLKILLQELKECKKKKRNTLQPSEDEFEKRGLKSEAIKNFFDKQSVKTFLKQCKDFKRIPNNRWMQSVYVLSHSIPLEAPKDSLVELNFRELPD